MAKGVSLMKSRSPCRVTVRDLEDLAAGDVLLDRAHAVALAGRTRTSGRRASPAGASASGRLANWLGLLRAAISAPPIRKIEVKPVRMVPVSQRQLNGAADRRLRRSPRRWPAAARCRDRSCRLSAPRRDRCQGVSAPSRSSRLPDRRVRLVCRPECPPAKPIVATLPRPAGTSQRDALRRCQPNFGLFWGANVAAVSTAPTASRSTDGESPR